MTHALWCKSPEVIWLLTMWETDQNRSCYWRKIPLFDCYVIHICQIKKIVRQGLMTLSTLAISRMCHNWAWHFSFNMWNGERHLIIIVAWINNDRIFIFSPFSPLTIFYHSIIDLWSSFMYSLSINWKNLDNC